METCEVSYPSGRRQMPAYLARPDGPGPFPGIVVIHEIFGLTDWVRGVADQLAEAGYIAIAPDLLSGAAPGGGGTAELGGNDAVRKAKAALKVPLIGFCGAPFTLSSYLVEGGASRRFARTKALMYGEPRVWHSLMEKLADTAVLNGNEMEKYKMEKSTEPTAMSLNIDDART